MHAAQPVPTSAQHEALLEIAEVNTGDELAMLLELVDRSLHIAVPDFHGHVVAHTR